MGAAKRLRGRVWGNALGGWRKQKRDARGRFGAGTGGVKKGKLTGKPIHDKLRAKQGGFVPYQRHGVGHNTVGVNAGGRISKNRRISAGFYVRTESDSGGKRAKKIAKKQEFAQLAVASRMPTGGARTRGGNLKRVKHFQSKILLKKIGGERKFGQNTYARVGTDRNALPVAVIRHNSKKRRKPKSRKKSNRGVVSYNTHAVPGARTYGWTQTPKAVRPQRRKKRR